MKTSTRFVAALLLLVLLAACGTPFGIGVANFLDSPENKAIVSFAVRTGVNSLIASQGGNLPPDVEQPLTDAAGAAASALNSGMISTAAQMLRTKQAPANATPSTVAAAASPATLAAVLTQASVPVSVAKPIALAVKALTLQGVSPNAANEAVAATLDGTAAAVAPAASTGKAIVPTQVNRRHPAWPASSRRTLYSASGAPVPPIHFAEPTVILREQ